MKILIVGADGFLGKEIFRELTNNGHVVFGMSRSVDSNRDKKWVSADIGKPDSYRSFISDWRPEVVIQSAWVTAQKTYRQSAENLNYASDTLQFAKEVRVYAQSLSRCRAKPRNIDLAAPYGTRIYTYGATSKKQHAHVHAYSAHQQSNSTNGLRGLA